ncbi:MAG: tryptophan synthase subunit beta, partial [Verrucomicrobia bacterium]|nr:tryptophan synthase subunit beta [Verrucomicrobiota bacterium]NBN95247.1 tryptophan synthase subunit beta [Verrucomicrobiota bacterium]
MSASSLIPTTEPRFRVPDARGRFGQFGGMYVPETLMTPLLDLTKAYDEA